MGEHETVNTQGLTLNRVFGVTARWRGRAGPIVPEVDIVFLFLVGFGFAERGQN